MEKQNVLANSLPVESSAAGSRNLESRSAHRGTASHSLGAEGRGPTSRVCRSVDALVCPSGDP